jgi:predicted N-acyltransferase
MPAELELELGGGVREVPAAEWNALVGDGSPFLEWEWLASLEEAGCVGPETGWAPRPLLLREAGRLVAACPLYVKCHSEGEFVFDWGWADAAERAGIATTPSCWWACPSRPSRAGAAWSRRIAIGRTGCASSPARCASSASRTTSRACT